MQLNEKSAFSLFIFHREKDRQRRERHTKRKKPLSIQADRINIIVGGERETVRLRHTDNER